ncbi:MAG TPA: hypothetical protein VGH33_07650 [Isosphaeraceae bacterium]
MQRPESTSASPDAPHGRIGPAGLDQACRAWESAGDEGPLRLWLAAELDYDGSPRHLPVEEWGPCVDRLARASRARLGWSNWVRTRAGGLFQWAVHGSRPDGSQVFGIPGKDPARTRALADAAVLATEPGLASVLGRWFPAAFPGRRRPAPPPPAAISDNDRVLAVLRPDWDDRGAWVAVDHRTRGQAGRLELAADGRPWLLGPWHHEGLSGPDVPPRPTRWETGPDAESLEWTFRAGPLKVTRTVVLLGDQEVALLAQQEDGPGPSPTSVLRVPLAVGVSGVPVADLRALELERPRSTARLIPLSLPALPYPTDRGSFAIEGGDAVLRHTSTARRRWLPLVFSWGRPPTGWRTLTVTEKSQVCPPDVAFAARISWGTGKEGLLIYRSLGRPALRAFLGHQTRARFLIGKFSPEGDVEPLLAID